MAQQFHSYIYSRDENMCPHKNWNVNVQSQAFFIIAKNGNKPNAYELIHR